MNFRIAAAALALTLLAACSKGHSATPISAQQASPTAEQPRSHDPFALGTAVDQAGAIPEDAVGDNFTHGGPVYLSVHVAGATIDQTVEVDWMSSENRVMHHERREVDRRTQWSAFSSGRTSAWGHGEHRAVVKINGRKVSERPFTLLGGRANSRV